MVGLSCRPSPWKSRGIQTAPPLAVAARGDPMRSSDAASRVASARSARIARISSSTRPVADDVDRAPVAEVRIQPEEPGPGGVRLVQPQEVRPHQLEQIDLLGVQRIDARRRAASA